MSQILLDVRKLSVALPSGEELVKDVSFSLKSGEILGLVGESGSGKTLTCRSLMQMLPSDKLAVSQGQALYEGNDIFQMSPEQLNTLRGRGIGMIFQNPSTHINPIIKVGEQVIESLQLKGKLPRGTAIKKAIELLSQMGIPEPERRFHSYIHELSGGMRQRVMIAIALAASPKILIADEPTTALDVTIQAQILSLLTKLRDDFNLSIILITHDLGVVAQVCDQVAVMYKGSICESGKTSTLLRHPEHGYTKCLIESCGHSLERALEGASRPQATLLEVKDLSVKFKVAKGLFKQQDFLAVNRVSLSVKEGSIVGLVGESGSGKSTLGRAILKLTHISSGSIGFNGLDIDKATKADLKRLRRETAMIFQDPFSSLNPKQTIGQAIKEVLIVCGKTVKTQIEARIDELLKMSGLNRDYKDRYPRELSGGQCQRAVIARALAVDPKLIVADECITALDVTIQAQIIRLLIELNQKFNLTILFISHDLSVIRRLCDYVVVMFHGQVVEEGLASQVFNEPKASYTKELIRSIPDINMIKHTA